MSAITKNNLPYYTTDDYCEWEGNWELIEGIPYSMSPAPTSKHQLINGKIFRQLDEALDDCPKCTAIIEAEWRINNDTIVIPDTSVICYEPEDYLTKAPNITFEVVSNSSYQRDEKIKFQIYADEGVEYYVLVYPSTLVAKVYKLVNGAYLKQGDFSIESYRFETKGCAINIDFKKVFKRFK
ncbi:MAG TPA: Uma2 family endonuclease [Leucothrix mucor]|nr:Uma2 family endonuclease [Leucothrix mucor]